MYCIFSCCNRLCEYRFTFSWRLWSLSSSVIVPCYYMRKCLDPTVMPQGVPQMSSLVWHLIQLSLEAWKWEMEHFPEKRRLLLSPTFCHPGATCLSSFSVDHHLLLTHQLLKGHSWVFLYLKKKDHLAGARALQKSILGKKPPVGLRWGDTSHFLFVLGMPSSVFGNWDKALTPWVASCCTSSHRLPSTDLQIRLASPTMPKPGHHSW